MPHSCVALPGGSAGGVVAADCVVPGGVAVLPGGVVGFLGDGDGAGSGVVPVGGAAGGLPLGGPTGGGVCP